MVQIWLFWLEGSVFFIPQRELVEILRYCPPGSYRPYSRHIPRKQIDNYRIYFLGRTSKLAFKCHIHSVCMCEHDLVGFRKYSMNWYIGSGDKLHAIHALLTLWIFKLRVLTVEQTKIHSLSNMKLSHTGWFSTDALSFLMKIFQWLFFELLTIKSMHSVC